MKKIRHISLLGITMILIVSCVSKKPNTPTQSEQPKETTTETPVDFDSIVLDEVDKEPLIFSVQLGISPQRPNWILFENGSYMLFKDALGKDVLIPAAKKRLSDFAKNLTTQTGISAQKANLAKGWIVNFGSSGIYNYVEESQIEEEFPTAAYIITLAQQNIIADNLSKKVIHFNKK